jgi:hypothetical protein
VGATYKVEAKPSDPALSFGADAEPFANPVLTDDNTVTYRTSAIRVAPDDVAITKVMAVRSKNTMPNSAADPMYHHRSKHRT